MGIVIIKYERIRQLVKSNTRTFDSIINIVVIVRAQVRSTRGTSFLGVQLLAKALGELCHIGVLSVTSNYVLSTKC